MQSIELPLLFVLLLPLIGIVLLGLHSALKLTIHPRRVLQLVNFLLICLVASFCFFSKMYDQQFQVPQTIASIVWFDSWGINLEFLFDSLSYLLIFFSSLIFFLIASAESRNNKTSYYAALLLVEFSLVGALLAHNLLVFYFLYELMLFPLFYLVYFYSYPGTQVESRRAIFKFILFTLSSSLLMLLAILYLGHQHHLQFGELAFGLLELLRVELDEPQQIYLMAAFFAAFAVKAPIFPFHTWLPDTYSTAPGAVRIVFAALLFQLGLYGLFRFLMPLFPTVFIDFSIVLAVLATIGIVHSALLAWKSESIQRSLAYISIAHVGFAALGFAVYDSIIGVSAALFLIIAHILIAAGMFFLVYILESRLESGDLRKLEGLAGIAPKLSCFFLLFSLATISLPMTVNFVGEYLVLQAVFAKWPVLACFALLGALLLTVTMLNLCQKFLYGEGNDLSREKVSDLNASEFGILTVLAGVVLLLGIYPRIVLGLIEPVASFQVWEMQQQESQENPLAPTMEQMKRKLNPGLSFASLSNEAERAYR